MKETIIRTPDMPPVILFTARNNLHLTKQAVRSALAQDVDCNILAVDNASTDGTSAWLNTKPVATIAYTEQRSLSACWNAGIKSAWKAGAGAVLCCNTDIDLRADTMRLLLEHGGEFVTCVSVEAKDKVGAPGDRTVDDLRITERPHPDFSCFLIRQSVTDKVGWFNEEYYPAYVEDAEYHIRMHRCGVRAVCVDLPFLHHGASTVKSACAPDLNKIRRGADANRLKFKTAYGCMPGTPEYYSMFGGSTPEHPM